MAESMMKDVIQRGDVGKGHGGLGNTIEFGALGGERLGKAGNLWRAGLS
jgi:hypothetical protein